MPEDGTLAEYIAVEADRLAEKPAHLDEEQAAAVPMAGLTAYRALFTQAGLPTKGAHDICVLVTGLPPPPPPTFPFPVSNSA